MRRLTLCLLICLTLIGSAQPADVYAPAIERLTTLIEREVRDKKLPALSIALVDDQRIVWAKGFGCQDVKQKIPAAAETVYRVGSVSKLFTDIAIMRLVEAGKIDLDQPVARYLPDFQPKNPFDQRAVTLRQLMAHRSGLIREPPVGNYFDPTAPSLADTVASVNGIDLVYPPGQRIKYSNAGIAVVGRVLEKLQGERFETYVKRDVLDLLGMEHSAFEATPLVKKYLADAVMWTYHGREFPAPTFELGMSPAGSLYSTVRDLGKFLSCLFAEGKAANGQLLKPETLAEMYRPQFAASGAKEGFGIGFMVGNPEGQRRIGHNGAVYGFATDLGALPDQKLGVVVVSSRDVANAVSTRIANDALRAMLAAKTGKPLPIFIETQPLPTADARALAGRYRAADRGFELIESAGRLWLFPDEGGYRVEVRADGANLRIDDVQAWGTVIERQDGKLKIGERIFEKQPDAGPPPEPPARWKGLIGEYGWDHNTLYIFERGGKLWALIEWTELDPLTEESENVFAFPDRYMYHGEKLIFTRDANGRATQVEAAKVVFKRRRVAGENGETFRITPRRPIAELRKEALAAAPPPSLGELRQPELVDLATIDPTIKLDIRYATDNNFCGTPFYTSARAFLQRPAAEALGRIHRKLAARGYGLLIHDAYRPWHVTKMFWEAAPEKFHRFVADPAKGSRHNRGCAVDLTLYDLQTGQPVAMVSGYDEFSDRAYPDFVGGASRQRWHRDLLRRMMEADGFTVYEAEWWHFDYAGWDKYPILNLTFEQLAEAGK
jgi:CubicO group peptidase (beta-lactamase class C family)/D-alanyl-D-alanine dipeptidase